MELTDKEAYSKFIQTVELQDIILDNLTAKRVSEPMGNQLSFNLSPNFTLAERTADRLMAIAEFGVKVEDGNNREVFSINAKFLLRYTYSKEVEVTEDIEERFLKTNVPVNVWPYGRELISSMTTRMGYPTLVIGTYKVF